MTELDADPVNHPNDLAWTVGRVAITRVEENIVPLTAKVLLPDATTDQVEANRPWIDPFFDGVAGWPPGTCGSRSTPS